MNEKIVHLTDDNFEINVLKAKGLVLVDFWTEWCSPCKRLASILEEIVDEYQDKLTIAKLEIDQNPNITSKYNIRSVPTLLLFKNGEVNSTHIGVLSKSKLKEFLHINLL